MSIVDRALAVALVLLGTTIEAAAAETATPVVPAAPAPATPIVPAAPAPAAPAATDTLTGLAAWEKLKGNTITGKAAGDTFAEFFNVNGTVKYVDKDGLSDGTWAVQNTKVCFDFPEDDDKSCSVFTVAGSGGTAVDDDGTTTQFEILPGNSKGL